MKTIHINTIKRNNKIFYSIIINIVMFLALINIPSIKVSAADNTQDILNTGKQIIKEYYIEDIPDSKLNEAKDMDSLVKSLNDPYSSYFTAKEYNDFTNSINNSFAGIGVQIDTAPDGIKIVSVYDKTPAMEVGLKEGDIIIEVNQHPLLGLSTEEAVSYIKGTPGTLVHLKVERGQTVLNFDVIRKQINLPTVVGKILDNHIGYIKISSFGENTSGEFKNSLTDLKNKSADSYIVDLRNNPGGYMDTAFDIAGYIIGNNTVLKGQRKSGEVQTYNATNQKEIIDKPLIFLINEYSASASEILSAAVKDYKKAVFIGEKTYGKGVAQSIFTLPDNSYLKLTILRFVSPLGNEINKIGVAPDIEIKDDIKSGIDSLTAAKILFNNLSSNSDKSDTVKVKLADRDFEINLNNAKSQDNINTFKYMAANVFNNPSISAGIENSADKNQIPNNTKINNKVLPPTGSGYDFYYYIELGFAFTLLGLCIRKK